MNENNLFYISGMTEDCNGGIFCCAWQNGAPQLRDFVPLERNTFLAWGKDRRTLYASMQHDGIGKAAAFQVQLDGKLHLLNTVPADGKSVCFLQMSADGKFLYSANYSSGNISEFLLNDDGSIAGLNRTITHHGKGIRAEQDAPHPHCCIFTPDNKFLCVTDLGIDKVFFYRFDPLHGIDPDAAAEYHLSAGSGPRHIFFDASGKFAYLLNELGNTLQSFRYENEKLLPIEKMSTLPDESIASSAATIKFSSNGNFLYSSNRGDDSIAVFTLDSNGRFTRQAFFPSGGSSPRDFTFLPDTEILAVANEFSGEVSFFNCDQDSGKIFTCCGKLSLPRPLYILT